MLKAERVGEYDVNIVSNAAGGIPAGTIIYLYVDMKTMTYKLVTSTL